MRCVVVVVLVVVVVVVVVVVAKGDRHDVVDCRSEACILCMPR